MSSAAMFAFIAVQLIIGFNLVFPLMLYTLYLTKRKHKNYEQPKGDVKYDYAIIVTAYEQTDSLTATINSILALDYENYVVYIVADKCNISDLKYADERIIVLRPEETLASNTRSHFYAIHRFTRRHDVLTIIDSDNLVDAQYLNELNKSFNTGVHAVQGLRKAKNLDTTYACLDAARDIYYHFYDGSILYNIGSSAMLAGSGMAFKTRLYRDCLEQMDVTGAGFDKVLQKEIVSRGHRIAFNKNAVVYDEKTSASAQLVKQRARWINTWFKYFGYGFSLIGTGIKSFNFNQTLFGVVLLRPPLFIFIILSAMFMLMNMWISIAALVAWIVAFNCFVLGFLISFFHSTPDKRITRSLINIPKFMFYQLWSLILMRKANKISVATRHYNSTTINELKG